MNSQIDSKLNIVLIEPEIPQNTGNIGRTCVGLGIPLHLVGQLGFKLDEKNLKRAGLDYWPKLDLRRHKSWGEFEKTIPPEAKLYFFSTKGRRLFWAENFEAPAYIIFGSESRGLPPSFYSKYEDRLIRIPTTDNIRSLNLATAAGITAFEAAKQLKINLSS